MAPSLLGILMLASSICATEGQRSAGTALEPAAVHGYEVVRSYPHDRQAFTQGLVFHEGYLYEGTGLRGQSSIRKVRLETGEVVQEQKLEEKYFGEGIAIWRDTLVQLTWQSEVGFVYELATFKRLRTFGFAGEGWGLTQDGSRLIMSDGSSTLRFLDPQTFRETGRLTVRDGAAPVHNLNELEFVKGEILANVYDGYSQAGADPMSQSYRIARISPKTGQVTAWVNMKGLLPPREAQGADVLNGIAWDAAGDRLLVTGKLWPRVFEIRIKP